LTYFTTSGRSFGSSAGTGSAVVNATTPQKTNKAIDFIFCVPPLQQCRIVHVLNATDNQLTCAFSSSSSASLLKEKIITQYKHTQSSFAFLLDDRLGFGARSNK